VNKFGQHIITQKGAPFFFFANLEDVHHCAIHTIIPYRKDLLAFSFSIFATE
jgi:hypothetical protein